MQKFKKSKIHYFFLLSYCVLALIFNSCTKINTKDDIYNETDKSSKFLSVPENTDPIVVKVINEIINRNSKKEFINGFAKKIGFPVWNKSIITTRNRVNSSSFANAGSTIDTLVYIPFAKEDSNSINGYILANLNNQIALSYYLTQDYKEFSFTQKPNKFNEASKFALRMIDLNRTTFGTADYKITDTRLFSSDTINNIIESLTFNNTTSTQNINSSSVNCTITITTTTTCGSAFTTTTSSATAFHCHTQVSSTMWCDPEWPGGNPIPEGGGGGGGDIPPAFPCTPNPSFTGFQNSGSSSIVPGGPLLPCPQTGTGWEPMPPPPATGPKDSSGYYLSRLQYINYILNQNPYALEPCDSLNIMPLDPIHGFGNMWQNVASFQLPQTIRNRIDSVNNIYPNQGEIIPMYPQTLAAASGAMVNCDFFPLRITSLPTGYTAASLLEYFRKHISDFTSSSFNPYIYMFPNGATFFDTARFNASYQNSIGSLVHIAILGNNGTVIESNYHNYTPPTYSNESHQFMYSTLYSPLDHAHPVGGNRAFGIYNKPNSPNEFTFYTMGVDRTWDWIDGLGNSPNNPFGQMVFDGADNLWNGMQFNFKEFINSLPGGHAEFFSQRSIIARPKWVDVERYLRGDIDFVQLKGILGC